MRRFPLLLALTAAAVALLAPAATARRAPTAVVPDGLYGVNAPRGEYILFRVRNRRISNLNFQVQITCQASDADTSDQRLFAAGRRMPQNWPITRDGRATIRWWENGNGRYGHIAMELKFGVRDIANFAIIVPEDRSGAAPDDARESCDGVSSLRFLRGYRPRL